MTSVAPTVASHSGHVRRGDNTRKLSVNPAGGKKATPASGDARYQKGRSAPSAYSAASTIARASSRSAAPLPAVIEDRSNGRLPSRPAGRVRKDLARVGIRCTATQASSGLRSVNPRATA